MEQILNPKTIAFDSNGGSNVASQTVFKGQTARRPQDPSKTDYIFESWYRDNETFLNEWNFTFIPTASMTLYANWTPVVRSPADISLTLEQITEGAPLPDNANDITISRTGSLYPVTRIVSVNVSDFDEGSILWEIAGSGSIYAGPPVTGTGASFTIDAADVRYNSLGGHTLRLTVAKDEVPYALNIEFTIVE